MSIPQANQAAQAEFRKIQDHTRFLSLQGEAGGAGIRAIPEGDWKITRHYFHEPPVWGAEGDFTAIEATSPDGRLWHRHINQKENQRDRTWGGWVEAGVETHGAFISYNSAVFGPGVHLSPDTTVIAAYVGPYTTTQGAVTIDNSEVRGTAAEPTLLKDSVITHNGEVVCSTVNKGHIYCAAHVSHSTVDDGTVCGQGATLAQKSVLSGGSTLSGLACATHSIIRDGSKVDGAGVFLENSTVQDKSRVVGNHIHIENSTVEGGMTIRHDLIDNRRPNKVEYKRMHPYSESPKRDRTQEK